MSDETIFATALEKADLAERAAYVAEVCAADPEQRKRIEKLLAAHDKASQFLERPVVTAQATSAPESESEQANTLPESESEQANTFNSDLGFLAPPLRTDSLGRIGHYEVLEVLGRGGFGIVFRALDDKLQRVVAVKVLSPQMAATSPARKRFLREARSAAAIQHENVVRIHETGEQPLPYLVMEFVAGETLQQWLDRTGPLEVSEAIRTARQIADGLAAAHERGLIHRDIKPANILIERGTQERVKITDFGLARAADDASLTRSGVVAGTPMYMAPEQAKGDTLDHRADLFSLGSVLYTTLTGRPPFRASGALAVLKRVCEETPRPIREIIPEVPEWLCHIVEKLHAKEPDERFQSAREVADLLADCEQQLKTHKEIRNFTRIPNAKPTSCRLRRGRRDGRHKWMILVAAVAMLAFLLPCVMCGGYLLIPVSTEKVHRPEIRELNEGSSVLEIKDPRRPPTPVIVAPFDAAKAKQLQEAWAKYLDVPVEVENSTGVKMRLIPPGEFTLGSSKSERELFKNEGNEAELKQQLPAFSVKLTSPYRIGTTEVTVGQFRRFVADTTYKTEAEDADGIGGDILDKGKHEWKKGIYWDNPGYAHNNDSPVTQVSWNDAVAFCNWLSRSAQLPEVYVKDKDAEGGWRVVPGPGYRLPTEAEWEYACRAGSESNYFFGSNSKLLGEYAWFKTNSDGHPHLIGKLRANPFGLFDVLGNVREWVADRQDETYGHELTPLMVDPQGPKIGTQRVMRGGDWCSTASGTQSASRSYIAPHLRLCYLGFRVARNEPMPKSK